MPENTVSPKYCPFRWCNSSHVDDWINHDESGDPSRSHTVDLGFADMHPYLVVTEVRTPAGVEFSPAQISVSDHQRVSIDAFAEQLHRVLAQLPTWREIAADIEDRRLAAASQENAS